MAARNFKMIMHKSKTSSKTKKSQKLDLFCFFIILAFFWAGSSLYTNAFAKHTASYPPTKHAKSTTAMQTNNRHLRSNLSIEANKIADFLGWENADSKNLCKGSYREPEIILKYPTPPPSKKIPTKITAKHRAYYSLHGDSTLEGNVIVTQQGREITADKIILHRDKKTNKISSADLYGNVHLREFGKLIIGDHAYVNFTNKFVTVDNAIYRISGKSPTGQVNVWGKAKRITRDKSKTLTLYNATYSTCQPGSKTWQIASKKLLLDHESGMGTVYNGALYWYGVPSFYMPYYHFPIDKRRKTGFLYPHISYRHSSGFDFTIPFYINLAPNYDAIIKPRIITKRGLLTSGVFRYLKKHSVGTFGISYIPYDKLFKKFREKAKTEYAGNAALKKLEDGKNSRFSVFWKDDTKFNNNWSSNLNLNYVSDDYFQHDFSDVPNIINNNQLLNNAEIKYTSEHWRFLGRLQAFQTLHMVTDLSPAANQYMRLPQLNLSGDYPNQKYGFDYHISNDFVNFMHENDFRTGSPVVSGSRFNIQPSISLPLKSASGYLTTRIQLANTFYSLVHQAKTNPASISRTVPLFNIDSGLIFERNMYFFGKNYTQTLEPRIFYLYVPYINQNDIPLFDTAFSSFNFNNLFRTNRFSGIDKIGDANQASAALTTRFLDANSGEEKLRASIGEILAFQKHRICINNNCAADSLATGNISPLIGELKYYLTPNWNITGDTSWDFKAKRVHDVTANFHYHAKTNQLLNIGYNYVTHGDLGDKDLNRIDSSFAFPIYKYWTVYADWNYNISLKKAQTYFYGIEYNSCCWAIRFLDGKVLTGYSNNNKNALYDKRYYIQFMLKGLGNMGSNGASQFIKSRVSGFHDIFNAGS